MFESKEQGAVRLVALLGLNTLHPVNSECRRQQSPVFLQAQGSPHGSYYLNVETAQNVSRGFLPDLSFSFFLFQPFNGDIHIIISLSTFPACRSKQEDRHQQISIVYALSDLFTYRYIYVKV